MSPIHPTPKRKRSSLQSSQDSLSITASKRRRLSGASQLAASTGRLQTLRNVIGGVLGFGAVLGSNKVEGNSSVHCPALDEIEDDIDELSSIADTRPSDRVIEDSEDELVRRDPSPVLDDAGSIEETQQPEVDNTTMTNSTITVGGAEIIASRSATHRSESIPEDMIKPSIPFAELEELRSLVREESVTSVINNSVSGGSPSEDGTRTSGRQRKRPRRFSDELGESLDHGPKSILTPNRNRGKGPRKSVAFQVGHVKDMDLGFKDLPAMTPKVGRPTKTRKATPARRVVEHISLANTPDRDDEEIESSTLPEPEPTTQTDELESSMKPAKSVYLDEDGEEVDDDTLCAVCHDGESLPPNEIILCDNCDLAVHQKCYDILQVPLGDWFCRDCKPDDGIETVDVDMLSEPNINLGALISDGPDIECVDYHLQVMQRLLLEKLTGRRRLQLRGLRAEYAKVHQLVLQTVVAGEGNSMLIIGSRGSGKTTLVEAVLEDVATEHRQDFHIIRLDGFIHTDDKLALREIWRQLGKEMEVEDDLTAKTSNVADTLASLLALLSHPEEISAEGLGETAKSVIFVLNEFDLFTMHSRQTLLYNLFDIAQARKAPIAILGMTTKIDVVESLEKRVKSRFSHRYVHLPLPKGLPEFWSLCKAGLTVDLNEIVEQGFDPGLAGQDEFLSYWNSMLNNLYSKDAIFKQHLQNHYHRSKSVTAFFTTCILPIAGLAPNLLPLTGQAFVSSATNLSPPDNKLHSLRSLAELDLALLICAARLDIILDSDTCNFAMAYDEYATLTAKHKIQSSSSGIAALGGSNKVWGKEVAIGAWERLADAELLIPVGASGNGANGAGVEGRMWRVDVGLEEIPASIDGLPGFMMKWCREI